VASLQSIDRIIPLYPYTPWGQELLSVWKLSGMRGFSRVYAGLLAVALGGTGPGCTVVPVPPRPGKIREKGWDQVEDLVRILEREHGIGVTRCLWRTARIQQKRLGRAGRVMNLRGHVSARPGFPVPETGILIDDLMTTGATLDSCAEALKSAGCRTVWGLTLFYD
jgi:Predicted amidophosphoribosyltransferases